MSVGRRGNLFMATRLVRNVSISLAIKEVVSIIPIPTRAIGDGEPERRTGAVPGCTPSGQPHPEAQEHDMKAWHPRRRWT
jgi:hypothetical protein